MSSILGFAVASAATALIFVNAMASDTSQLGDIRYSGPGCPPGSASAALYRLNDDAPPSEFAIYFSKFFAAQGAGISAGERSKKCKVTLHFDLPKSRQFAVSGVQFNGYADIAAGASASQVATYWFPSVSDTKRFSTQLDGPFANNYSRLDNLGGNGLLWSRCGTGIPFFIQLSVDVIGNRGVSAIVTADQATGQLTQRFKLLWKDCAF